MRLKALAKINLGLDILRKRDDGYHEVRMVMQTIQMYDILDIYKCSRPGIHLKTNLPYIWCIKPPVCLWKNSILNADCRLL